MRVLFVNHTSSASGAELALMRLVEGMAGDHAVAVACPEGPLAELVRSAGVAHVGLPAFEPSLRLDPVHTPLGLARLAGAVQSLARSSRRFGADLLHANTPRAGLIGAGARLLGAPPLVVRAHEQLPLTGVGRGVRFTLAHSAAAVLTVSRHTARHFNQGMRRPLATHVYNSFDRARFDPARVEPAPLREELGIAPGTPLLGQIAQITPWKGQDTAIAALAELREDGSDAQLVLVGEVAFAGRTVRYDNPAYERELHRLVDRHGLRDRVHFLGRRADVPAIMLALDLTLLPSWDEPFANVMLESMAMGTPLLVSDVGGGPELVEDGVSGRLLAPRRPELWAGAVRELLGDRPALDAMGLAAQAATEGFRDDVHVRQMMCVYRRVLGRPEQAADGERRAELAA